MELFHSQLPDSEQAQKTPRDPGSCKWALPTTLFVTSFCYRHRTITFQKEASQSMRLGGDCRRSDEDEEEIEGLREEIDMQSSTGPGEPGVGPSRPRLTRPGSVYRAFSGVFSPSFVRIASARHITTPHRATVPAIK